MAAQAVPPGTTDAGLVARARPLRTPPTPPSPSNPHQERFSYAANQHYPASKQPRRRVHGMHIVAGSRAAPTLGTVGAAALVPAGAPKPNGLRFKACSSYRERLEAMRRLAQDREEVSPPPSPPPCTG